MALPKKQVRENLLEWGLPEENIDKAVQYILNGNSASLDALREQLDQMKQERDSLEGKAATVDALTKERDEWKAKAEASSDAAKIQSDFDAYKQQVETERKTARIDNAVLEACKKAGIQRESLLRMVAKDFDRSKVQTDDNGEVTNADELVTIIKADYADCVATTQVTGTPPNNPPTGGGKGMTREQILAISDKAEQRAAIAQNLELFTPKN